MLHFLLYSLYILFLKTVRVKFLNTELLVELWQQNKTVLFCCPHHLLLAGIMAFDKTMPGHPPLTVIVSRSQDGELLGKILKRRGIRLARGSSNRGGRQGLWEMAQAAKAGENLGIAYDGPKGPPLVPKRGVVGCARQVNGAAFLVSGRWFPGPLFGYPRLWRAPSWDRFWVPLPFCRFEISLEVIPHPVGAEADERLLEYIKKTDPPQSF